MLWSMARPLDDGSDLLRIAVAHQRDAVLITEAEPVDPAGRRIMFVNPAFTAMTGWTAATATTTSRAATASTPCSTGATPPWFH